MNNALIDLAEDMHVHSTFSDGRDSVLENVNRAQQVGLRRFACVDHVRKDSSFIPEFVAEVQRVRRQSSIEILIGVEAKILDLRGELDLPADLGGVDLIYAADHQIPIGDRCHRPLEVRQLLRAGLLSEQDVIRCLVVATLAVLQRYRGIVLAHLFSALPKVEISEGSVPHSLLTTLAAAAKEADAAIEIDERWRCPGARTLRIFHQAGVPIFLSTDSHSKDTIGSYSYAASVVKQVLG